MRKTTSGFTIVELLIVIVVIAILAAITIVAYNGIQQRARASEASAALSQAKKKLELYKVDNSSYPTSGNLSAAGVSDGDVSFQYTSDGSTYCITGTATNVSYKATNTTSPTAGGCPGHGQGGVAAITNFVTNPSFESNSSGWITANGTSIARPTSLKYSGNYSAAITRTGTGDDFLYMTIGGLTSGQTYTFSAWLYLTATGSTGNNRHFWIYNQSGGAPTIEVPYDDTKLNQWQRVSATMQVVNTSVQMRIYAVTGATLYIDGVMTTSGSSSYNYADGNSTDWTWNGTTNNSTSTGPPL